MNTLLLLNLERWSLSSSLLLSFSPSWPTFPPTLLPDYIKPSSAYLVKQKCPVWEYPDKVKEGLQKKKKRKKREREGGKEAKGGGEGKKRKGNKAKWRWEEREKEGWGEREQSLPPHMIHLDVHLCTTCLQTPKPRLCVSRLRKRNMVHVVF